jgi:hypothetical protein
VRAAIFGEKRELAATDATLILAGSILLAGIDTQGDIPFGLMQTSLRSRLGRMPHGRHIKTQENK